MASPRDEYERGGQIRSALAAKHGVNVHTMKGQFHPAQVVALVAEDPEALAATLRLLRQRC